MLASCLLLPLFRARTLVGWVVGGAARYDPEELDEERRERKLRKRLNDLFDTFVKKCEKLVESLGEEHLQFDIPFRDLGFTGVPHKADCFLMPSKGVRTRAAACV